MRAPSLREASLGGRCERCVPRRSSAPSSSCGACCQLAPIPAPSRTVSSRKFHPAQLCSQFDGARRRLDIESWCPSAYRSGYTSPPLDCVLFEPLLERLSGIQPQRSRVDNREVGLDVAGEVVHGYAEGFRGLLLVEGEARHGAPDALLARHRVRSGGGG